MAPKIYREVFAPRASLPGPSGLANPPRPFVFRTRHLDGQAFLPGQAFDVHVNLFYSDADLVPNLTEAFAEMGRLGFGPQRSLATLLESTCTPHSYPLPPSTGPEIRKVRIEFLTPTELKSGSALSGMPQFYLLLRRARDRISNLRSLYGAGPLNLDFEALNLHAAAIQLVADETYHVNASRRSSRSTQVHPLGGLMGAAEYSGSLSEFLPFLQIASHTGVGRQTVWGKGEIATEVLA